MSVVMMFVFLTSSYCAPLIILINLDIVINTVKFLCMILLKTDKTIVRYYCGLFLLCVIMTFDIV